MKWVKRMGMGLLVVLIVLILVINFFGGSLIKKGIETAAPGILGVPVTVEDVNFRLVAGKVGIKNLVIGNPEGFKSDYLFKLGTLKVSLDMGSLFSDTIIIEEIRVIEPGVTYELALGSSNIGKLLEHLEGDEPKEKKPEAEEKKPKVGLVATNSSSSAVVVPPAFAEVMIEGPAVAFR